MTTTALPQTTKRRLKKIPQIPSVWEGDRRPLGNMASHLESDLDVEGECIMWVDGSEGCVRAMDVVPAHMGIEAVVRTLLRAIESPHHPAQPARPQKIIVRDREIQFFLRGALQNLDIAIEYVPDLPLIDQLFRGFEEMSNRETTSLAPYYENLLKDIAQQVWDQQPWELLADRDILILEFSDWEIEPIYVCVMGMMAAEYGVLLYRSLDSLKQFRASALRNKSVEELEQAFLTQDCWFLNYEDLEDEDDEEEEDWEEEEIGEIVPFFGSLHPYEGMRSFLDEDEVKIVYTALVAMLKFCQTYEDELAEETIEKLTKTYRISLPKDDHKTEKISVKVSTLPELTEELLALNENINLVEEEETDLPIEEDLIPDGSLVTLGHVSLEILEQLKQQSITYYQSLDIAPSQEGLPAILIQTSRPKAKTIIEKIQQAGGLKAICFNPGNDPFTGDNYELGMLQTGNNNLYIFAEYSQDISQHIQAIKRWHQRCQKVKGYCSLIIAMGVTGTSKGNPQPKDMLAIFEAKAIKGEDLGMGVLQLMPHFEIE
ncbi:hypothetical protein Sta7437_0198 [Stanieria cyanosphaera PCC 7437]|uniref:Uncharacterized protein n=1 Tax=Stanieria cyanosphaera (strain ATCC 29371 / PCC 7437) TaxID=111780 RepID=K9XP44_STAC7|nr:hypothetical protein [Stanieria cyanosphaera]AFZ33816.1 hypothetical protein Sta7437_0198 [Stanieria cyanosphaera PCC 7437]